MNAETDSRDRALWLAVIQQQLDDATSLRPNAVNERLHDAARQEAREWLLTPSIDFDDVCALAGVEPRDIRRIAQDRIDAYEAQPTKTRSATITHEGVTRTIKEWSIITGLSVAVIHHRQNSGWTGADLFQPKLPRGTRTSKASPFGLDLNPQAIPV